MLYLIALTAGSFCFLIQFIRSYSPPFLFMISWIFWSKNECFILLTVFLNCFQSSKLLVDLYFSRSLLQFKSHQLFKYMVILTIFEFLFYISSMVLASKLMTFSSDSTLVKLFVSIALISLIKSLMKDFSFLLPLMIDCFLFWTYFLMIGMVIVSGAWSEDKCQLGWIE